jgi:ATP-binding cassette subfamily F protein uup
MSLLTVQSGRLAFGHVALLDGVDLSIELGERLALIGRNGTGKSSLLKILAGLASLDDGRVVRKAQSSLAYVAQEPQFDASHTVRQAVAAGLPDFANRLARYHDLSHRLAARPPAQRDSAGVDQRLIDELAALQTELDAHDGWSIEHRIDSVLSRLGLAADASIASLSGGTRKRVALARALVAQPDLLLLDEPTNHLDIESIQWLEELLLARREATLVITHDRQLMDRVATRIVELDRGVLRSYPGSFADYQRRKAEELAQEQVSHARFDKLLAQEEVWIRQGVQARRKRNEGRVRRLETLRRERDQRRDRVGQSRLEIDTGERSGKLVAELTNVGKAWQGHWAVRHLDCIVSRGDRVGLIGPNGAGKTTLLKLMLGELEPDEGLVRRGTQLSIAYFDQMRASLDDEATLADTISPGSEWIEIGGTRTHVMSYLGRFLFAPERARSPVKSLSGGERNRLLLARLFARPANLLVLDEPTNDLDVETLELLEELLSEYPGTVLLVSHDRAFLDAVVTQSIAFETDGHWLEYAGGYSEVQATRARQNTSSESQVKGTRPAKLAALGERSSPNPAPSAESTGAIANAQPPRPQRAKLSYKEQRELESLPGRIEALENEQAELSAQLAHPDSYRDRTLDLRASSDRLSSIEGELMECLERWEALESRNSA